MPFFRKEHTLDEVSKSCFTTPPFACFLLCSSAIILSLIADGRSIFPYMGSAFFPPPSCAKMTFSCACGPPPRRSLTGSSTPDGRPSSFSPPVHLPPQSVLVKERAGTIARSSPSPQDVPPPLHKRKRECATHHELRDLPPKCLLLMALPFSSVGLSYPRASCFLADSKFFRVVSDLGRGSLGADTRHGRHLIT